MPSPRL